MTYAKTEVCSSDSLKNRLERRIEAAARASGVTLLFLLIVAVPMGLTYVELAFAS